MNEGKKLFKVTVEHEVYVLAHDEGDAKDQAERGIREYGDEPTVEALEVKSAVGVPRDWFGAIPFGAEGGVTIAQWFTAQH